MKGFLYPENTIVETESNFGTFSFIGLGTEITGYKELYYEFSPFINDFNTIVLFDDFYIGSNDMGVIGSVNKKVFKIIGDVSKDLIRYLKNNGFEENDDLCTIFDSLRDVRYDYITWSIMGSTRLLKCKDNERTDLVKLLTKYKRKVQEYVQFNIKPVIVPWNKKVLVSLFPVNVVPLGSYSISEIIDIMNVIVPLSMLNDVVNLIKGSDENYYVISSNALYSLIRINNETLLIDNIGERIIKVDDDKIKTDKLVFEKLSDPGLVVVRDNVTIFKSTGKYYITTGKNFFGMSEYFERQLESMGL